MAHWHVAWVVAGVPFSLLLTVGGFWSLSGGVFCDGFIRRADGRWNGQQRTEEGELDPSLSRPHVAVPYDVTNYHPSPTVTRMLLLA